MCDWNLTTLPIRRSWGLTPISLAAPVSGGCVDAPEVTITPGIIGNVWYMSLGRYNTRAKVERVK